MKGIAVPYIIAILLGVGVIGLVGYWLFVSGGRLGTTTAENNCKNDLLAICNQALTAGGLDEVTWTQTDACKSVNKYPTKVTSADCSSVGVSVTGETPPA